MKLLDKNTKLNDRIIQQLYRIKTIDRNSEWDVIWYLGGKNQVTLGEKAGKYYLLPPEDSLIGGNKHYNGIQLIRTLGDLTKSYPELSHLIQSRDGI